MGFSYGYGSNPEIDYPRFLVADTQEFGPDGTTPIYVFDDREILLASQVTRLAWRSSMTYSGVQGAAALPPQPKSYYRIAACLLDALASNNAKLAKALKVLDVQVSAQGAAQELRAQAAAFRDVDDNCGAIVIIEQVNTTFAFRDRYWKTIQRQSAQ
jgi:hypothetical protein